MMALVVMMMMMMMMTHKFTMFINITVTKFAEATHMAQRYS